SATPEASWAIARPHLGQEPDCFDAVVPRGVVAERRVATPHSPLISGGCRANVVVHLLAMRHARRQIAEGESEGDQRPAPVKRDASSKPEESAADLPVRPHICAGVVVEDLAP